MYYTPDAKIAEREEAREKKHLAALAAALTPSEQAHIVKEAANLKTH